jgi:hypothetical protein
MTRRRVIYLFAEELEALLNVPRVLARLFTVLTERLLDLGPLCAVLESLKNLDELLLHLQRGAQVAS